MQITFEEQNQCARSYEIFQRKGPSAGPPADKGVFQSVFLDSAFPYFILLADKLE